MDIPLPSFTAWGTASAWFARATGSGMKLHATSWSGSTGSSASTVSKDTSIKIIIIIRQEKRDMISSSSEATSPISSNIHHRCPSALCSFYPASGSRTGVHSGVYMSINQGWWIELLHGATGPSNFLTDDGHYEDTPIYLPWCDIFMIDKMETWQGSGHSAANCTRRSWDC